MAFGAGRVWVANGEGYVSGIDPATGDVEKLGINGSPEGAAFDDETGLVWVTFRSGRPAPPKPGAPNG